MRDHREDDVGVALDLKVKTSPPGDPRLPDIGGLVVLLGAEGGVAEILEKESKLLVEGFLDVLGSAANLFARALGVAEAHAKLGALPLLAFLGAPGERTHEFIDRVEGAVGAPLPYVLKREGELPVDDALRAEGDLLALDRGLEEIAHGQARLPAKRGGEGDLVLVFDLDEWHGHAPIVQC